MYEFLGTNFNSLQEIFNVGIFLGFILYFIFSLIESLIAYISERAMYWHDKRKELKRERENRKNC